VTGALTWHLEARCGTPDLPFCRQFTYGGIWPQVGSLRTTLIGRTDRQRRAGFMTLRRGRRFPWKSCGAGASIGRRAAKAANGDWRPRLGWAR